MHFFRIIINNVEDVFAMIPIHLYISDFLIWDILWASLFV